MSASGENALALEKGKRGLFQTPNAQHRLEHNKREQSYPKAHNSYKVSATGFLYSVVLPIIRIQALIYRMSFNLGLEAWSRVRQSTLEETAQGKPADGLSEPSRNQIIALEKGLQKSCTVMMKDMFPGNF